MSIEAVEIRAGDVLVVSYPGSLPAGAVDEIKKRVEEKFPGHKVLVLAAGLSLQVIRPAA